MINNRRSISKISVLWFKNHVNGLRFTDDKGINFVNEIWYEKKGDWETKEVPAGSELIGIQCNTDSLSFSMPVLNFMLWCPKVTYDDLNMPIAAPILETVKSREPNNNTDITYKKHKRVRSS